MESKKKVMGRGIRALLTNIEDTVNQGVESVNNTEKSSGISTIEIAKIQVNPFQPRKDFNEQSLEELVASIKIHGIIQPITLRKLDANTFQLISGERRFRASQLAGLHEVPAYVRTANDQEMLEMALIENIQREDLNAIEVAFSYQRLIEECSLTHEQMSERVAKNRSTVTNYLRLLKLPPEIQLALKSNKISMGHARSLSGIQDVAMQLMLAKKVADEELSVRALEQLIQDLQNDKNKQKKTDNTLPLNADYRHVQDKLSGFFHQKVNLKLKGEGKGQIT
ncbi:MAG: ParB/RepB/Spo0J family partition protein, partial [Saprospiraceae bacterium]